jgi:uncharacterized membrane protein
MEKNKRSFFKALSWRITGTVDTIVISFIFTGHITTAVKIGAAEVITKIALYYLHERGWNLIYWGRKDGEKDSNARSLSKAVSWRAVGTMDTIFLSFLLTGQLTTALKIGGTEVITKIIIFYFHERIWNMVGWGRKKAEVKSAIESTVQPTLQAIK